MNSVLILKTMISTTTVENIATYLIKEKSKTVAICNSNTLVRSYRDTAIRDKINSSSNEHSTKYTSPLKYFEYIHGGLKVLAVDFESHRVLPFSDYIKFFKENDEESFVDQLISIDNKFLVEKDLYTISLENRIVKILNFLKD